MKKIFSLILFVITSLTIFAQDNIDMTYHRSSWCNILIYHNDQKYAEEILTAYSNRPKNEKFNDHSLPVSIVTTKGKKYAKLRKIDKYVMNNKIANELVAKWFDRNDSTGYCNMELIYRRGVEGASTEELEMSELTKRGKAVLMDSGTDLIGNTFVLVHDIIYIDKGEKNKRRAAGINAFGSFLQFIGETMSYATGDASFYELGRGVNQLSYVAADVVDDFEGFRVKIQTHLYRLNWNEGDADFFYDNYYLDENYYDEKKFLSWQDANYQLSYVGTQEAICGKTVLKGVYDLSQLMQIVVYRTMDESIVKLQKNHEEFKIKEPIYDIDENGCVIAKIGLKEGVSMNSKYEVLERIETSDGAMKYKRVGVIKPVENKIWDNRYMAKEDGMENSDLEGTHFRVLSGGDIYPGLLIREIRF